MPFKPNAILTYFANIPPSNENKNEPVTLYRPAEVVLNQQPHFNVLQPHEIQTIFELA